MERELVNRSAEVTGHEACASASTSTRKYANKKYQRTFLICPIPGCDRKFDRRGRLEKHVQTHTEGQATQARPGFCKQCYQLKGHLTPDDCCLSCDRSVTQSRKENQHSSLALVTAISNNAPERAQRLSTYFNTYCVYRTVHEGQAIRRMSVLPALMDIDFQSSSLLRTAIDTLTQAHFAQVSKLRNALYSAQASYGILLRTLSNAMEKVQTRSRQSDTSPYSDREIIVGLMLLALLTSFENPLQIPAKEDHFMVHYTGTRRFLNARGARCLNPNSTMDNSIYMGLVTSSTLMEIAGIDSKYSVTFDNPEWNDNDPFVSTGANFYSQEEDFLSLIKPLPALLRRVDLLTRSSELEFDHGLYDTLQLFRQKLGRFVPASGELEEVDFSIDDQLLDVEIEEHCFIASSSIITTFHQFADADAARDAMLSSMINLVVECALMRLQLASNAPSHLSERQTLERNMQHSYELAMLLCRGVWYLSSLQSMAYLRFLVVFLNMAQQIFEQLGERAVAEYGWTQACLLATNLRMKRLRDSGVVTLCFAHELGPGMRERCRWRARRRSVVTVDGTP